MEIPLFLGKQRVFDLQILTGGVEVAGSNPVSPTYKFESESKILNLDLTFNFACLFY